MKKIFLSFASSDLNKSLKRILLQANSLKIYDEVLVCTEFDLDESFKIKFSKYLQFGTRGYGFWSWKPQIILQTLNKMEEGDILQYTDAGCHLNINGLGRLNEYFEITKNSNSGILAFQAKTPEPPLPYDGRKLLDCIEYKWVKGDLLDYFDVRSKDSILKTQTITATTIFIKKTCKTIDLINVWLDVIKYDFRLIDDTKSISKNLDGFIEHRHDQAIFSILCKLNNIDTLSAYEYWYPSKMNKFKPDWKILSEYPILAKRDKVFDINSFISILIWRINKKLKRIFINILNLKKY
jgi:hypothetical protein